MQRAGVVLGAVEGGTADIGADSEGFAAERGKHRQQKSAGARPEVGDAESARTSLVCGDCRKRCLDHRLCFGAGKKKVPAKLEPQPPEFLVVPGASKRTTGAA